MSTDRSRADRQVVNNGWYDTLEWGNRQNGALALLRSEGALKNAWVADRLVSRGLAAAKVLDVGCGGGFLSNHLAQQGHDVTGIDLSASSLKYARRTDATRRVHYQEADAYDLPFADATFDVVTCLDFLEHVSAPELVVHQAARVLKPQGLFFFHTFNRNPLSWLLAAKALEWFIDGGPEKLHVAKLFIKPRELNAMMTANGLVRVEQRGLRPAFNRSLFRVLETGLVDDGFQFVWTRSTSVSYAGYATKGSTSVSPPG